MRAMTASEEDLKAVHVVEFDRDELRSLADDIRSAADCYRDHYGNGASRRYHRLLDLADLLEDEWENPPTEVR